VRVVADFVKVRAQIHSMHEPAISENNVTPLGLAGSATPHGLQNAPSGIRIAGHPLEVSVSQKEDDNLTVVPLPASETEAEHARIRRSNDRDQALEREGKPSRHNRGYDEAADGPKTREVVSIDDE
jgi:hypothetical protein